MAIGDIQLQQFRSYQNDSFEFSPAVNIIVGPNASGKTNLLEAILVVCQGGSYRVRDQELIAFNQPWARLEAHLDDSSVRVVKLLQEGVVKKLFEIDGQVVRRLGSKSTLPVVLFEPDHLQLLSGSPEARRNYLDDLLVQIRPGYKTTLNHYRRTLAQRNSLLKQSAAKSQDHLFPWNVRLSELAGKIVRERAALSKQIQETLPGLYHELARSETDITIEYQHLYPVQQYESRLLQELESGLHDDILRGYTRRGPHREDFKILHNKRDADEVASRGEIRTVVLALKIIELQILEEATGKRPILLLDDVFSELDGSRRKLLTTHIEPYQSFITTTDADIVVQNFTETCNIIPLDTNR